MLPLAALLERPWTASPDAATWTALAALGLVSTAFAYILYFRILATAGATNVLLVTFLVPITALLLGTLILGERISLMALAGMALIFAGLAVIDGRLPRLLRAALGSGSRAAPPPCLAAAENSFTGVRRSFTSP